MILIVSFSSGPEIFHGSFKAAAHWKTVGNRILTNFLSVVSSSGRFSFLTRSRGFFSFLTSSLTRAWGSVGLMLYVHHPKTYSASYSSLALRRAILRISSLFSTAFIAVRQTSDNFLHNPNIQSRPGSVRLCWVPRGLR